MNKLRLNRLPSDMIIKSASNQILGRLKMNNGSTLIPEAYTISVHNLYSQRWHFISLLPTQAIPEITCKCVILSVVLVHVIASVIKS